MRLTSHYLTIYFFLLYFSQSHHQQTPLRPPTSDLKIPAPTLSTPSKRWVAKNVPSPPNDGAARTYLKRSSWRTTIVRTSGRSHIRRRSCRSDTAIVSRRNGSSVGYLVAENTNMWTFIMTRNTKRFWSRKLISKVRTILRCPTQVRYVPDKVIYSGVRWTFCKSAVQEWAVSMRYIFQMKKLLITVPNQDILFILRGIFSGTLGRSFVQITYEGYL